MAVEVEVYVLDHGGEASGLSAARDAGDEDEAVGMLGKGAESLGRKFEVLEGGYVEGEITQSDGEAASGAEDIGSKAGLLRVVEGDVGFSGLLESFEVFGGGYMLNDGLHVFRGDGFAADGFHEAVEPDARGRAGLEEEVGGVSIDHEIKQFVEVHFSARGRLASRSASVGW